jgi:hypothetical protein
MANQSQVEKRARAVCVELVRQTGDRQMQYRMVRRIARAVALDYETADAAIVYAVGKGWLLGEGEPPHSICLTDDGRVIGHRSDGARTLFPPPMLC